MLDNELKKQRFSNLNISTSTHQRISFGVAVSTSETLDAGSSHAGSVATRDYIVAYVFGSQT